MKRRKGYSYDFPFLKATFEYYCPQCNKITQCIDDLVTRNTCASCGSPRILKGKVGSLILLKHNSKEKKGK